ncbi:MAG: peroxide stress protein YaaA [Pseudomonadota bacterium]
MLVVLSPAKALDFSENSICSDQTEPVFQDRANVLASVMRSLSHEDLKGLMGISDDLAKLNKARFAAFGTSDSGESKKAALFAFAGDTYVGFDASTLTRDVLEYAQDHLRILSGLYGVLRPLDGIEPYRLEMGSRLVTDQGRTLYDYWSDKIANSLDATSGGQPIVNCASTEYFKAAALHVKSPVITPAFKEERGNTLKMIGFFAKKARGAMARYIVEKRIDDPKDLEGFDFGGYRFRNDLSERGAPVFTRKTPEPALAK